MFFQIEFFLLLVTELVNLLYSVDIFSCTNCQSSVISELSQFELLFLLSSVKFSILIFDINRENARAMLNCGIVSKI